MDIKLDPTQLSPTAFDLQTKLESKIIAQDRAIHQFVMIYQSICAGLNPPNHPAGVLLLMGPTGTGKTAVCRAFAEALFGSPDAMMKIDCAEFQHSHEISKLIGSPPGYVGYREHARLTQAAIDKYCKPTLKLSLLLFDEIERADESLFDFLLGVMDSGKATLGSGEEVDFRNTLLVMTSNLGASEVRFAFDSSGIGFHSEQETHDVLDDRVYSIAKEAAKKTFRPQFLNRVDRLVVFRSLSGDSYQKILSIMIQEVQDRIISSFVPFVLDVQESARAFLIKEGVNAVYGARELSRAIRKFLVHPLSSLVGSGQLEIGDRVVVSYDSGRELVFEKRGDAVIAPKKLAPEPEFDPFSLLGGSAIRKLSLPQPDSQIANPEDRRNPELCEYIFKQGCRA